MQFQLVLLLELFNKEKIRKQLGYAGYTQKGQNSINTRFHLPNSNQIGISCKGSSAITFSLGKGSSAITFYLLYIKNIIFFQKQKIKKSFVR